MRKRTKKRRGKIEPKRKEQTHSVSFAPLLLRTGPAIVYLVGPALGSAAGRVEVEQRGLGPLRAMRPQRGRPLWVVVAASMVLGVGGVSVGVVVLLVVSRRCGIVSEDGMQRVVVSQSSAPTGNCRARGLDACARAAAGGAKWTSQCSHGSGRIGLSDVVRRQRFLQRALSGSQALWALVRSWRRCRPEERAQVAGLCLEQIHRAAGGPRASQPPGTGTVSGRSVSLSVSRRCPAGAWSCCVERRISRLLFLPRPRHRPPRRRPLGKSEPVSSSDLFHTGRPRVERHVMDRGFRRPWAFPSKKAPCSTRLGGKVESESLLLCLPEARPLFAALSNGSESCRMHSLATVLRDVPGKAAQRGTRAIIDEFPLVWNPQRLTTDTDTTPN